MISYIFNAIIGGGGENIRSPSHFSYWGVARPPPHRTPPHLLLPELVSTSPAFMRSIAIHPAGSHGWLSPTKKTVIGPHRPAAKSNI